MAGSGVPYWACLSLDLLEPLMEQDLTVTAFLADWRLHAASSLGSSWVSKKLWNHRSCLPKSDVHCVSHLKDKSVCIWSFASACHSAMIKRREAMSLSWAESSRRLSNTGIAHYRSVQLISNYSKTQGSNKPAKILIIVSCHFLHGWHIFRKLPDCSMAKCRNLSVSSIKCLNCSFSYHDLD